MTDLVLHGLPMSHKKDARLIWVKLPFSCQVTVCDVFRLFITVPRVGLQCVIVTFVYCVNNEAPIPYLFEILLGIMIIKFSKAMSVWMYTHITLALLTAP